MPLTETQILERLETLAKAGADLAALQRMAATRGVVFRGIRPDAVTVTGDEFRAPTRQGDSDVRAERATKKPAPRPEEPRGADLNQELASAMRTNGFVDVTPTQRTAYHEAGHAVLGAVLYGRRAEDPALGAFRVSSVSLEFAPPNTFVGVVGGTPSGVTRFGVPASGDYPPRENAEARLAGFVAETLAFGGIEDEAITSRDVRQAMAAMGGDVEHLGDCWRSAKRVLIDHWPAVETVAAALLERLDLTGAQVEALLAGG